MNIDYLKFLKTLNILYVEDEENIRRNIVKTLLLLVNSVTTASNGREALSLLKNNHIDIILSDISMPEMSGIELSKEVRKNNKNIPIILLTAHTDTNFLLEATRLKLIDYIIKPLDFNQLKEALIKSSNEIYDSGNFCINFENNIHYNLSKKKLYIDTEEINITAKEIILLEFLYKNRKRVVPTIEIKNNVWEDEYEATDSALKGVLNKLRKKIGKDSIKNISGIGYQLNTN
ncbi:response regulator transcription factor [Halarcobacter sp.]|uniref:response regulator transcription factor n=1 Tax=Halarcobacter sp. TaxID=2321133 RepID=UPI0029F4D16A|nr:response regulator transcription factor [Halarcobacter sp.]